VVRLKADFNAGIRNPLIPTPNPITKNMTPTSINGMMVLFFFVLAWFITVVLVLKA